MDYGSAYARAARRDDEDTVSMLSPAGSQSPEEYKPYRLVERRKSSEDLTLQDTPLCLPTSARLHQTTSQGPDRAPSPVVTMGFSVFGDNTTSGSPYQEQVAWANSTKFQPSQPEKRPETAQTTYTESDVGTKRSSRKYFRDARHMLEPWTAGFQIRFPWWGLGAIFLILLFTGASAGVLLASHGSTMDDWKIGRDNAQPHVYVSVFEMLMNFLILFALVEGVVIRFWRQLLRGTTLDSLHDTYESVHLPSALRRMFRLNFNIVAVASLLTAISFARGPLFHRALTLEENSKRSIDGAIDLNIATEPVLELFESGESDIRKQGGTAWTFSSIIADLSTDKPLAFPSACGDYCTGTIKGYAFKASCESTVRSISVAKVLEQCVSCTSEQCESLCEVRSQTGASSDFFSIGYKQLDESLVLTSVHKNAPSCKEDMQVQTCTLTPAMADIPVILTNGNIDLRSDAPISRFHDDSVDTSEVIMKKYWPLAFDALFPSLSINITLSSDRKRLDYNKCVQPPMTRDRYGNATNANAQASCSSDTSALLPSLLVNDPSIVYAAKAQQPQGEDPTCGLTWNDPMPDMIRKMQSLAFRTAVASAALPDSVFKPALTDDALATLRSSWTQNVPVTGYHTVSVYHVSPLLVALGIVVSIVGVAAVLPLYNGFWEMGRKVSLNPLEIARAFGAPLLDELDGNSTPDMIAVERGDMAIRYGAVDRYGEQKTLRVTDCGKTTVRVPWQGEIFG